MKYDFTSIIDRHDKDSIAYDAIGKLEGFAPDLPDDGFSRIPMWVADMNFVTAPPVVRAIKERLDHPIFGYFSIPDKYYEAIINWHKVNNGILDLKKEDIGYENSVLGGLVSALTSYASPGDKVLVHSPTYIGFTNTLLNNGYHIIDSPLIKDKDGRWVMDYEDMDSKIKLHNITVAIFCSPHNPCGRVWEKEELEKAMEVYEKNGVMVISDEIWSDIILSNKKHIPSQSINSWAKNNVVALYAISKTFNLAGLVASYHIIYNQSLKNRIVSKGSKSHYNQMNVLSMHALLGAYSREGKEWKDELCSVISENVDYAYDFIKDNFKGIDVFKPEGTYMMYLDCSKWCEINNVDFEEVLRAGYRVGVSWQDGRMFKKDKTIRLNLALPKSLLIEAFSRLKTLVFK